MADNVLARALDATDATIGGGSAAALTGAMAAGLVGLVARLSPGRDLGLSDAEYGDVYVEAGGLAQALAAGAQEDADAYGLVKAAYGLPRAGEDAAVARRTAIDEALVAAATVPLQSSRRALRVRELCAKLTASSNPAAGSDLAAAVLLADAAIRGCLLNVDVNVCALSESSPAARLRREAEAVRASHERARR